MPGACSIGIHLLLAEIGAPFELRKVDLKSGEQRAPEFLSINPKSKVPVLERDDGSFLTQFPAIAVWLARTNPEKALLPADDEGEARALEAMDYIVSTVHMQGFARLNRPAAFSAHEADHEAVRAEGRGIVERGFSILSRSFRGAPYLLGAFSIADAALFYVEFWARTRFGLPLPEPLALHFESLSARPAVQRVLLAEGLV